MKIILKNNLTSAHLAYMSAENLPENYICEQVSCHISQAQKDIGVVGVFSIEIPMVGKFNFTLKALCFGEGFELQIVSWSNEKQPVSKEYMPSFRASLLKELHLAIENDEEFLITVNEVKGAGTVAYSAFKANWKSTKISKTNLLGDTVTTTVTVNDNSALV